MRLHVGLAAASALLFLCCQPHSEAQPAASDRVAFSCACNDSTGRLFASAMRDALDRTGRFREVSVGRSPDRAAAVFSIVSLPLDDDSRGESHSTALSVVFLRDGVMLDHLVETCQRAAVESCARSTVSAFESTLRAH